MRYIAMLRGINVSGKNLIKMDALRKSLSSLKSLQTYIQSGNLVFDADKTSPIALEKRIGTVILKEFGFQVPVTIRTSGEFEKIMRHNPFLKIKSIDPAKLHVTFLSELPASNALAKLKALSSPPDQFQIRGREIFIHCPESYGETKLSNSAFETILGVRATTRNWKTINKLLEIAKTPSLDVKF